MADTKKKGNFFSRLFNYKVPESRNKLTKKFKDASKKKYDAAKSGNMKPAKKELDDKIKKNREDNFGTKKSGIPEKTQSKKRLFTTKKENVPMPKKRPKSIKPKNYGLGGTDSLSKSKVKQGPPKPPKKAPIKKKKSKSNIKGSSSYDADFTKKGLEKRGLDPKGRMSKSNMAKTTSAKNKKNAAGQDFGGKKKKVEAPMYESMGTMGGVKKIKMAKGYSKGGTVFTGR